MRTYVVAGIIALFGEHLAARKRNKSFDQLQISLGSSHVYRRVAIL
jgi:hypothetical protein